MRGRRGGESLRGCSFQHAEGLTTGHCQRPNPVEASFFPFSMVVHNLHVVNVTLTLCEADAPLVPDPNAVLSGAASLQHFKPISANGSQVGETGRGIEPAKPFSRRVLDVPKLAAAEAVVQCPGFYASKRSDHRCDVLRVA